MAFNFKSIVNKIKEGGKLLLVVPTMVFRDKKAIKCTEHVVKVDEAGRPDLICLEHYGNEEYVDYLLKYNNISDPFSIAYLDVIKIPILSFDWGGIDRPKGAVENIVRQEFISNKKLKPKDQRRVDFLKKKYGIKEVLPPNVLKTGFKTFKFMEVDGESATVMGAQAQNPESNAKKRKKSLGNVHTDKIAATVKEDKELSKIASKDVETLTDKEIAKLANKGISVKDLKEIDKANVEAGVISNETESVESYDGKNMNDNDSTKTIQKKFDSNGKYIGTESTIESKNVDDDKLTVTVTKTLIMPDGTVETTQTTSFQKAKSFGEIEGKDERQRAEKEEKERTEKAKADAIRKRKEQKIAFQKITADYIAKTMAEIKNRNNNNNG